MSVSQSEIIYQQNIESDGFLTKKTHSGQPVVLIVSKRHDFHFYRKLLGSYFLKTLQPTKKMEYLFTLPIAQNVPNIVLKKQKTKLRNPKKKGFSFQERK